MKSLKIYCDDDRSSLSINKSDSVGQHACHSSFILLIIIATTVHKYIERKKGGKYQ